MTEVGRIVPDIGARSGPVDVEVAMLADRQHGVVARRQLLTLGLGRRAIQHRVELGRLHPVHAGVYAVGHTPRTANARRMAAVLACGNGAVLSHVTAADHLLLLRTSSGRIDVTALRSVNGPGGVVVHRTRRLRLEDRTVHEAIPVTSVARTLVDLAGTVTRQRLERAVETAEQLQVFDLDALERVLEVSNGRRGVKALREVLFTYSDPPFTRSDLERFVLRLLRETGLEMPAANVWIAGGEADLVWERQKLVVELDTRTFHATHAAFERDRKRDAERLLAGYRTLRLTGHRVQHEPEAVLGEIRSLLSQVPQAARAADVTSGVATR